jgi:hypothetical protein
MTWVAVGAWGAAALLAVVVVGFCAYEIIWKTRRLQRDVRGLQAQAAQLAELRARLVEAQQRLAATGLR